jgi:hypothetical protein
MNQHYLQRARVFLHQREESEGMALRDPVQDLSHCEVPSSPEAPEQVIALATYQSNKIGASCRRCGHGLSVVAVRDICGRCAAKELAAELTESTTIAAAEDERHLRGRLLADIDRRGFPRLHLLDGSSAGPGLLAWGPVLREMTTDQLRLLERSLTNLPGAMSEVTDL